MRSKSSLLIVALAVVALSGLGCPEDCLESDPNLAVDRIDIEVTPVDTTHGTVQITGVVENKGGSTFDSSPGQQAVDLYEGSALTPVAQTEFEDLAVGETVTVTYTVTGWSTTQEFPPTYRVYINLDPDILIDGNPNNDECPVTDNAMEVTGAQINAEF